MKFFDNGETEHTEEAEAGMWDPEKMEKSRNKKM